MDFDITIPEIHVNFTIPDMEGNMDTLATTTPVYHWDNDYFIAGAILFPLVIILLVANILMLAAVMDMIISRRPGESCSGPILVLNLAIGDIMTGIASLLSIADTGQQYDILTWCYAKIGLLGSPVTATSLIMASIAMDRYINVRDPFRDRRHDTKKILVVVILIWIVSSLIGFAPLMGWRCANPQCPGGRCVFLLVVPDSYVFFVFFGIILPVLTVTSYLHIAMCQASKKQSRKIAACALPTSRFLQRVSTIQCITDGSAVQIPASSAEVELHQKKGTAPAWESSQRVFTVSRSEIIPRRLSEVVSPSKFLRLPEDRLRRPSSAPSTFKVHRNASNSSNLPKILSTLKPMKWSRTVLLILGLYISMWMPFWITCVTQALCAVCHVEDLASSYMLVVGIANSAVNPLVYISTDKKLKEHFCQCFFKTSEFSSEDITSIFLSDDSSEE